MIRTSRFELALRFALIVIVFTGACLIPAIQGRSQAQLRGMPCGSNAFDPLAVALDGTLSAYRRGDLEATRYWFAFAAALLASAPSSPSSSWRWPTSNANQLLVVLEMYECAARGRSAALDAEHADLFEWCLELDALNRDLDGSHAIDPPDVERELISKLVRRLGELRIEYDLITWQITRLGPYAIDYDLITGLPTEIGDIEIHYDLIDRLPDEIAGVRLR